MSWFENERNWFAVAVALYGCSLLYSVFLWRRGFREHNRVNYLLILGGFCFHTVTMVMRGFSFSRCPVNNLFEATIFAEWALVATYLVLGVWTRLRFLGAFASPILVGLGVFALMPQLDAPYETKPQFTHGWSSLHASLILLSYGAFGVGSVAGLMYLSQEHNLKFHKLKAVLSLLPPIQRLELVVGRALVTGFVLLTAGLVSGAFYLKQEFGVWYKADAKILWSAFVWVLYLVLLTMHWGFSQGGRRFAWGAVGSFFFILLTFWGFNLLSSIHHP